MKKNKICKHDSVQIGEGYHRYDDGSSAFIQTYKCTICGKKLVKKHLLPCCFS